MLQAWFPFVHDKWISFSLIPLYDVHCSQTWIESEHSHLGMLQHTPFHRHQLLATTTTTTKLPKLTKLLYISTHSCGKGANLQNNRNEIGSLCFEHLCVAREIFVFSNKLPRLKLSEKINNNDYCVQQNAYYLCCFSVSWVLQWSSQASPAILEWLTHLASISRRYRFDARSNE